MNPPLLPHTVSNLNFISPVFCKFTYYKAVFNFLGDFDHERSFESYAEEEEEYDGSPDRSNYNNRGRGRGKMRGSGRGRGRMNTSNEGGRGGFMSKRGGKRGNRGSPAGKFRGGRERTQDTICEYFMQGKCPKVRFVLVKSYANYLLVIPSNI